MKLNHHQSLSIVRYLTDTFVFNFLYHHYDVLAELFEGHSTELRIIPRYGMSGKLWNNNGRIYITGYSPDEIGKKEYKAQQKELDKINDDLRMIVEAWK